MKAGQVIRKLVLFCLELFAFILAVGASGESNCGADTARALRKRHAISHDEYIRATQYD